MRVCFECLGEQILDLALKPKKGVTYPAHDHVEVEEPNATIFCLAALSWLRRSFSETYAAFFSAFAVVALMAFTTIYSAICPNPSRSGLLLVGWRDMFSMSSGCKILICIVSGKLPASIFYRPPMPTQPLCVCSNGLLQCCKNSTVSSRTVQRILNNRFTFVSLICRRRCPRRNTPEISHTLKEQIRTTL